MYNEHAVIARIKLQFPAGTADADVGGGDAACNMRAEDNIADQGRGQPRIQHILDGIVHVRLQS